MPLDRRFPKWVGFLIAPLLLVPLALAVRPIEGEWFFVVAAAMCFCAALGGLWWGECKGQSSGTRAALGCAATFGFFVIYGVWTFVVARLLFDR